MYGGVNVCMFVCTPAHSAMANDDAVGDGSLLPGRP